MKTSAPANAVRASVRAVLFYAVFAALWIVSSDRLAGLLFPDPATLQVANTVKGLLFVAVTSLLLLLLLLRVTARDVPEDAATEANGSAPGRPAPVGSIALISIAFALLGVGSLMQSWDEHRLLAKQQLESIAALKAAQIEAWLTERRGDAGLAGRTPVFAERLPEWRRRGDAGSRAHLLARLEDIRATYGYHGALLCDANGGILLQAGDPGHDTSPELRDAIRRAVATGETQTTGLFATTAPSPHHVHLDFVAPAGTDRTPADAAIVLRTDVEATIWRFLQVWPVPSESAETLLVRRDGDDLVFLNDLRHRKNMALGLRLPLADRAVLAAQALSPGYQPGTLLEGVDYRGVPVIGIARLVAGTDWWLVAKVDRNEIFGEARKDAAWIVLSSLVFWLATVALAVLVFQRRELRQEKMQRRAQAEKIRAQGLVSAIAESSEDAIFAKDRQGRYLLFNRAAARFTGKSESEVVGNDDSVLFPADQATMVRANDQRVIDENRVFACEEALETALGPRTFLAVKGPLHDDRGEVVGLYGISRDISERANAEETLRASNEELQRFNRAMIGRELDMVRLKREVNALAAELGRPAPYDLTAIDAGTEPPETPT